MVKIETVNIYVWIPKKDAIELTLYSALSGVFFSPETISKGDDIKIKRKVGPFFFRLHVYLPFIAVLSLFFVRLHSLEAA